MSWRMPPGGNQYPPQQQHQYQQVFPPQQQQAPPVIQQHLPPQQLPQPPPLQFPPQLPQGNPPADSWRNVARESSTASTGSSSRRDRSRSRSRERSTRRRSRSRSPDDRRRRSRSRDRHRRRSPDEPKAVTGPTKRVFITQLPYEIQHEPLMMIFARQGFLTNELKIVDKQDRGSLRSMGIVEFVDAASAKKWMDQNQSTLTIPDGRKVSAEYVPKNDEECFKRRDWICAKCTLANYMKRETCFRCNVAKAESDKLEARGFADIGDREPCDTLLIRDLPDDLTELHLLNILQRVTQNMLRFSRVKLSESREFAWVELRNASDAGTLLSTFQRSPLLVNGSIVITTFSRRPLSVITGDPVITEKPKPPTVEEPPVQPQAGFGGQFGVPGIAPPMNPMMPPPNMMPPFGMPPPGMQHPPPGMPPGVPNTAMPPPNFMVPPPGMMGGPPPPQQQQQLLQTQLEAARHMGMMPNMSMPPPTAYNMPPPQMQQHQQQPMAAAAAAPAAGSDSAMLQAQLAAMAAQQAALQAQLQQIAGAAPAAAVPEPEKLGHILTPVGLLQQYETPNPHTCRPDPTTGYMHDPKTNLYYDPKTQYFYNTVSGKWNYYDAHFKTYIPVDDRPKVHQALLEGFGTKSNVAAAGDSAAAAAAAAKPDEKKTPSEIAKEMMKWAKKADKQAKVQMSLKPAVKTLETKSAFGSSIVASIADHQQTPGTVPTVGQVSGFGTEVTLKMLDRSKNPLAHLNSDSEDEDSMGNGRAADAVGRGGVSQQHVQQAAREMMQRHNIPQPEVPVKEEPKFRTSGEHREAMMATLIDRAGKQCLLCRRAFPTVEVLDKHIAKSDLHKKNLEEKQIEWGKAYVASIMAASDGKGAGGGEDYAASTSAAPSSYSSGHNSSSSWGGGGGSAAAAAGGSGDYKYRDRAKERRNVHGIDAITADPFGNRGGGGGASVDMMMRESDASAARPLDSGNIGSKLLQKMGWQEGGGVGKNLQGIAAPITAERRVEGTGLGLAGSKITHGMHASHQDKTRAALFARYQ